MITIDDKIDSFKRIINEDIKLKSDREIKSIKEETDKKIQEYKAKKNKEIENIKRDYKLKLEIKADSIHSKTLKEGQNIILNANKEIYEEFFKELRISLKNQYMNYAGENYIKNELYKVKDEIKQDDIIYVFEKTYDRDKELISKILGNINIQKSQNIKIGGFEIENLDRTYRINCSLDFLLDRKYTDILTKLKEKIGIFG